MFWTGALVAWWPPPTPIWTGVGIALVAALFKLYLARID